MKMFLSSSASLGSSSFLQFGIERVDFRFCRFDFFGGEVFHFRVGQHFFGIRQVALRQLIVLEHFDDRRQFGMFARELAVVVHIGRGFGLSEEVGDFFQSVAELL